MYETAMRYKRVKWYGHLKVVGTALLVFGPRYASVVKMGRISTRGYT